MMTDLAGRAALVTGGGRGIGAAIARRPARHGADVAVTYVRAPERAAFVAAQAAARVLGPRGITANVVQPGSTDTEMNPADSPDAEFERGFSALGRYGRAEEIAAMVAHLAGPGGDYVTGAAIAVDGGYAA